VKTANLSSRPDGPRATRGFTLVELLVVLVLVGIVLLVAIPNLRRVQIKAQVSRALRNVDNVFLRARGEAVKRHSPVGIVINAQTRQFTVFEDWDPGNANVPTNGNGVRDANEDIIATRTLDREVSFAAKPSGDTDPQPDLKGSTVFYGSDGALRSAGGALYLADNRGNEFRIRVVAATGAARVEMWTGNTWTPRREQWVWKY